MLPIIHLIPCVESEFLRMKSEDSSLVMTAEVSCGRALMLPLLPDAFRDTVKEGMGFIRFDDHYVC